MDSEKKVAYLKCSFDPVIELILKEQKEKKEKKDKSKKNKPKGHEEKEVIENSYFLKHE
jgi:hypothetical protein